jgi:hypothetical protein
MRSVERTSIILRRKRGLAARSLQCHVFIVQAQLALPRAQHGAFVRHFLSAIHFPVISNITRRLFHSHLL